MLDRVRNKLHRGCFLGYYPTEVRYDLTIPPNTPLWSGNNLTPVPRHAGKFGTPAKKTPGAGTPYRIQPCKHFHAGELGIETRADLKRLAGQIPEMSCGVLACAAHLRVKTKQARHPPLERVKLRLKGQGTIGGEGGGDLEQD